MEMEHIGQHCQHADCHQRDFLPFTCDCCDGVFCLSHRTYKSHSCPKAASKDTHVIICPLCAGAVRLTGDEDPNVAFERHTSSTCKPSRRKERLHKPRCAHKTCHKKLTLTNKFKCDGCRQEFCPSHRYADAHQCAPAVKARAKNKSFLSSLARKPAAKPTQRSAQARSTAAKRRRLAASRKPDPANTLMGTAARRRQRAAAAAPTAASAVPASVLAGSGSGPERCTECGARFATVMELISHAEGWHAAGAAAPAAQPATSATRPAAAAGSLGNGGCPYCGAAFSDPVELVSHVESGCSHAGTPQLQQQRSCTVS